MASKVEVFRCPAYHCMYWSDDVGRCPKHGIGLIRVFEDADYMRFRSRFWNKTIRRKRKKLRQLLGDNREREASRYEKKSTASASGFV